MSIIRHWDRVCFHGEELTLEESRIVDGIIQAIDSLATESYTIVLERFLDFWVQLPPINIIRGCLVQEFFLRRLDETRGKILSDLYGQLLADARRMFPNVTPSTGDMRTQQLVREAELTS